MTVLKIDYSREEKNENAKSRGREGNQRLMYFIVPFIRHKANK